MSENRQNWKEHPIVYAIILKKEVSNMHTFDDLVNITNKLRSKDGCPWDKEQAASCFW